MAVFCPFFGLGVASATETVQVDVGVGGIISISPPSSIDTDTIALRVITNDSSGYKLEWQASDSAIYNNNLEKGTASKEEEAYKPRPYSAVAAGSEYVARLSEKSTDYDHKWGGAINPKWLEISTAPREIVARSGATSENGSTEYFHFQAGANPDRDQPAENYKVNVAITATIL